MADSQCLRWRFEERETGAIESPVAISRPALLNLVSALPKRRRSKQGRDQSCSLNVGKMEQGFILVIRWRGKGVNEHEIRSRSRNLTAWVNGYQDLQYVQIRRALRNIIHNKWATSFRLFNDSFVHNLRRICLLSKNMPPVYLSIYSISNRDYN